MNLPLGNITFGPALKDFDKFFVGFDEQFDHMKKLHSDLAKNIPNYPPYNIKKVDDTKYVIEIAVAGFSKSEIEITLDEDTLTVKGVSKEDDNYSYLFKGIGMRDFARTFALNDKVEIKNAGLVNGMLKIALERILPEVKKSKKIDINDSEETPTLKKKASTSQYLTENDL